MDWSNLLGKRSVNPTHEFTNYGTEFVSKIGDCLKEIDETEYWLELLVESGCVGGAKMGRLIEETRQLIAIFTAIHKKAKEKDEV